MPKNAPDCTKIDRGWIASPAFNPILRFTLCAPETEAAESRGS